MAFPDGSFDRVLSTLFFHHLVSADKQATIAEIARVLKPGCSVHVADWASHRAHSTLGVLPDPTAGWICLNPRTRHRRADIAVSQRRIRAVEEIACLRTVFGTLRFIRAEKLSLTIDQPSLKWPLMTTTGSLPLLQALGPPISAPSPLCPAYSPVLRRRRRRDMWSAFHRATGEPEYCMSKRGKAFDIRYISVSYADIERDLAHDRLYPRTAAVSTL